MFGESIINQIKEAMPELQDLQILIGKRGLNIDNYELINAFLIQNNVLDETKKNVAIFHPKSDLLDVYYLIIMGLAAYKYSILHNSKLRLNDFKVDELVEYEGKVLIYNGLVVDPVTKSEKFQLIYGDKYNFFPRDETFPLQFFPEVLKYTGRKTKADTFGSKKDTKNIQGALQKLLGFQGKNIGLSGYPTFLISTERSRLIELLREVTINGTPFLDMFPSIKCTSENQQRLGRGDILQRSPMFYFVSSLSVADDVLKTNLQIRTLFINARGRSLNYGTLLASIRSQYNIEDIYLLQTYERLDSVDKLSRGLDYKIWIWDKNDYTELLKLDYDRKLDNSTDDSDLEQMVNEHNETSIRLANYIDQLIEIPYPQNVTSDLHNLIQHQIREIFTLNNDYSNIDLLNFSIHIAGILNKIFQSTLSTNQLDEINKTLERKTFEEEIISLKEKILTLSNGTLPENFKNKLNELISNLEILINAFNDYDAKYNQVVSIIKENPNKSICIITSSKYPTISAYLMDRLANELGNEINVINNLTQLKNGYDILIWTYKPSSRNFLMLESRVGENYILLYPLQKKEFESSIAFNKYYFQRYKEQTYRADILNIPVGVFEIKPTIVASQEIKMIEPFDLDELLSLTISKGIPNYRNNGHYEIVDARMVLFSDGTHALFQSGNKIRVLDIENEKIEIKTINTLLIGDQIAFLQNSKRTVFEELVEYYEHKPEIVELIKMSELWRDALLEHKKLHLLHPIKIKRQLDEVGLSRNIETIENWLEGNIICPDENNYEPIDKISQITNNKNLIENLDKVKDAGRKLHSFRIKIGRYLAKKLTQSFISPDSIIDDPVLRNKLDEVSSHVHIAEVSSINEETSKVPIDITNKLLTEENI